MIVFDLRCAKEHVFEAWFPDNATFEQQRDGKKVDCPVCGSRIIEKAPMAPNISTGKAGKTVGSDRAAKETEAMAKIMDECRALRKEVERTSDYVGPRFAEEARKMHYGEAGQRSIYGEASDTEAKELTDEGVPVTAIPWIPPTDS
jgi:hypothetical protein